MRRFFVSFAPFEAFLFGQGGETIAYFPTLWYNGREFGESQMKIKWYGTAGLLLESFGTRILFDPYLKRNPALYPVPLDEARTAEAIFITHPHFDHFSDIDAFTKEGGVREVHVSRNGIDVAQKNGLYTDCMEPMSAGDRYEVGPFTVKVHAGKHCVFDLWTVLGVALSPRTYFKYFRPGVLRIRDTKNFKMKDDIYVFEVTDGEKRVAILGSAGLRKGTAYPQDCDLLVFPYQGRTGMHRYLKKFLVAFKPRGVLIDHFDDAFPPYTHEMNVKKFAPAVKKSLGEGARVLVPEAGIWYEV